MKAAAGVLPTLHFQTNAQKAKLGVVEGVSVVQVVIGAVVRVELGDRQVETVIEREGWVIGRQGAEG
jgi:hypothetical protein